MTKEALRLALEALEMFCEHGAILRPIETRDAIKKALANEALEKMAENARELGLDYEPPQRTWAGLTDEEKASFWKADQMTQKEWDELFVAIEAALKAKNT